MRLGEHLFAREVPHLKAEISREFNLELQFRGAELQSHGGDGVSSKL